jgi:[ribosomal protein S18]-alanine N-acetyltransferase
MNETTLERLIIRRVTKADAKAVFDLQEELFPADINGLSLEEFSALDGGGTVDVLVAELEHTLKGFLMLRSRDFRPWTSIDFVAVSPGASGQGIGGQLLAAAEFISSRPVLRLFVRPSNAAARALYRRSGFRHASTRKANYPDGEDALIQMKWVGYKSFRRKPPQMNAPDLIKA